jgi:hypothetical protein
MFLAFGWHADSCEGVDVVGGVFEGDEEVVVGVADECFVLAFVLLAGVVGGDAGVHDGGDGEGTEVALDQVGCDGLNVFSAVRTSRGGDR